MRMTLARARLILNGDVPADRVEAGYATGVVLARLDEIDRRAAQIRDGYLVADHMSGGSQLQLS